MKVKLLKDHLNYKAGDKVEVDEPMATYWKRVGVAEEEKAPAKTATKAATKSAKK